jgi:GGDEF domain-containing protein
MMELARPLVLLDITDTCDLKMADVIRLEKDCELALLPSRLAAQARRRGREIECRLRAETAKHLGTAARSPDPDAPLALLYASEGAPLFLGLIGALRQRGIHVAAALSRHTVASYERERRFAAALIDLDTTVGSPSGFDRWLIEEDGLSTLPLYVLTHRERPLTQRDKPILNRAAEIIPVEGRILEVAVQIERQARRRVSSQPLAPVPELSSQITDLVTGFFNRRFFENHLNRQIESASDTGAPLSLLSLQLDPGVAGSRPVQAALARIIRPMIRDTDVPALLQPGTIGIALPMTPYRGGARLAARLASAMAREIELRGVQVASRIVEKRAYHTAETFLASALIGPFARVPALI